MDLFKTIDPDFGEDYSDEDISADSSEDDIDIILHGTPEQKRKLYKKSNKGDNSSSEDDFEKEMNQELQETVDALESKRLTNISDLQMNIKEKSEKDKGCNMITDKEQRKTDTHKVSCESDEEETDKDPENKIQSVVSNDDLLYDPDLDDEDQKWIDKQRKECQPKSSNTAENKLPRTDGVLNCPACMTTLCRDCQRHETYQNQYRAMFVTNCDVTLSETLKYPKQEEKRRKRKNHNKMDERMNENTETIMDDEIYHPVKCSECQTVVGVYDKDEIYYFFNVLTSYS